MTQSNNFEVKMQAHSMSCPNSFLNDELSYNWDNEVRLMEDKLKQNSIEESINAIEHVDQQSYEDCRITEINPFEFAVSSSLPMDCENLWDFENSIDKDNFLSIGTISSEENNDSSKGKIDRQLDFILDSVRPQKNSIPRKILYQKPKRKFTRMHKTESQVKLLQEAMNENKIFDKARIKELAERTGLTASQVYKWYWDNKKRVSS